MAARRPTLLSVSHCDLTPGTTSAGRPQDDVAVLISNLPTGDLTYLDADYTFRVTNTANKK